MVFLPNSAKVNNFEHAISGCPYNSHCNKQMGRYLIDFEKAVKNHRLASYIQKHGFPIEVWFTQHDDNEAFAKWNNHCNPTSPFEIGHTITKSLKKIYDQPIKYEPSSETSETLFQYNFILSAVSSSIRL